MKAAIMVPSADGGCWDVRDVQRSVVTPGHVLIRVRSSSLNRAEFRRLHNLRMRPGQTPPEARTGGGDAAGEVVEIGAGVTGIKPGDRVMGRCAGGFAEFALLDAREVMPAPERLSWQEAACVGEAISREIGDDGVDMVVDNIGADVLAPCLDALAVGGRFVTIGRMSGVTKGELDVDRLAERRLHLYGVSNRLRTPAQRAESAKRFAADLLPALGDGRLQPVIDRCFPLDQIAAAGAYLETDKHVGKVVIEI